MTSNSQNEKPKRKLLTGKEESPCYIATIATMIEHLKGHSTKIINDAVREMGDWDKTPYTVIKAFSTRVAEKIITGFSTNKNGNKYTNKGLKLTKLFAKKAKPKKTNNNKKTRLTKGPDRV